MTYKQTPTSTGVWVEGNRGIGEKKRKSEGVRGKVYVSMATAEYSKHGQKACVTEPMKTDVLMTSFAVTLTSAKKNKQTKKCFLAAC